MGHFQVRKLTQITRGNYGTSPFLMGKSTIKMTILAFLEIRNPGNYKWFSLFNCFCLKSLAFDPATPETTGTPGFPYISFKIVILRGLRVEVCAAVVVANLRHFPLLGSNWRVLGCGVWQPMLSWIQWVRCGNLEYNNDWRVWPIFNILQTKAAKQREPLKFPGFRISRYTDIYLYIFRLTYMCIILMETQLKGYNLKFQSQPWAPAAKEIWCALLWRQWWAISFLLALTHIANLQEVDCTPHRSI